MLVVILLPDFAFGQDHCKKGIVNIKVSEEMADQLESTLNAADSSFAVYSGNEELDAMSSQFKCRRISRMFPYNERFEAKHRKYGLHRWYTVLIDSGVAIADAVKEYGELEFVEFAEPEFETQLVDGSFEPIVVESEFIAPLISSPNDPLYNNQWHYVNTGQGGGVPGADINLLKAWRTTTGNNDVIVSVHDQGIESTHEDLSANLWVNEDEIPGNGIDDDGNGYIDDVNGYGFRENIGNYTPGNHGTHVAGTIAAVTNNGKGGAGIAGGSGNGDGVKVMSCAVFLNNSGFRFQQSFVYAADNGAVISQNSWSYNNPGIFVRSIADAIDYFIAEAGKDEFGNQYGKLNGGIVIFAAANDNDYRRYFPASYEPVVAVAATSGKDKKSYYSNYGDWVDIAAPGGDFWEDNMILSTITSNRYAYYQGTSMACPHVSGAVALLVSAYGKIGYSPERIKSQLFNSADDISDKNPGYPFQLGWGRLDVGNAMKQQVIKNPYVWLFDSLLDVGSVINLPSTEFQFHLANRGINELKIESITSSNGIIQDQYFNNNLISVKAFERKSLTFKGSTEFIGAWVDTLIIKTNDPINSEMKLPVKGEFLTPPKMIIVNPPSHLVVKNSEDTQSYFYLKNEGGNNLEASIESINPPSGSTRPNLNLSISNPLEVIVAPGDSLKVEFTINSTFKDRGEYNSEIKIISNDPENENLVLPVSISLIGPSVVFDADNFEDKVTTDGIKIYSTTVTNVGEIGTEIEFGKQPSEFYNGFVKGIDYIYGTGFEKRSNLVGNRDKFITNSYWKVSSINPYTGINNLRGEFNTGESGGITPRLYTVPIGRRDLVMEFKFSIASGNKWMFVLADRISPNENLTIDLEAKKMILDSYNLDAIEVDIDLQMNQYYHLRIEATNGHHNLKVFIDDVLYLESEEEDRFKFSEVGFSLPEPCSGNCIIDIDDYKIYRGEYKSFDYDQIEIVSEKSFLNPGESSNVEIKVIGSGHDYGEYFNDVSVDYKVDAGLFALRTLIYDLPSVDIQVNNNASVYYQQDTTLMLNVKNTGGTNLLLFTEFADIFNSEFQKKQNYLINENFESQNPPLGWEVNAIRGSLLWGPVGNVYNRPEPTEECLIDDNDIGMDGYDGFGNSELISPLISYNGGDLYLEYDGSMTNLLGRTSLILSIKQEDQTEWTDILVWDDYFQDYSCRHVKFNLKDYLPAGKRFQFRWVGDQIDYASGVSLDNIKVYSEGSSLINNSLGVISIPIEGEVDLPLSIDAIGLLSGEYPVEMHLFDLIYDLDTTLNFDLTVLEPAKPILKNTRFQTIVEQGRTVSIPLTIENSGESPLEIEMPYELPVVDNNFDVGEVIFKMDPDQWPLGGLKKAAGIGLNEGVTISSLMPYSGTNHIIMNGNSNSNIASSAYVPIYFSIDSLTSISMFVNFDSAQSSSINIQSTKLRTQSGKPYFRVEDGELFYVSNSGVEATGVRVGKGYQQLVFSYNPSTKENKLFLNGNEVFNRVEYNEPIKSLAISASSQEQNYLNIDDIMIRNGHALMPVIRPDILKLKVMPGETANVNVLIDGSLLNKGDYQKIIPLLESGVLNGTDTENLNYEFSIVEAACNLSSITNQSFLGISSATSSNSEWQLPDRANDGLVFTKWQSTFDPDQYYEVDLGKVNMIDSIRILWDFNYASSFEILVRSSETDEWTTWYSTFTNTSKLTELLLPQTTARYVRLKLNTPATMYGYSFFEFELFGGCAEGDPVLTSIHINPEYYSLSSGESVQYDFKAKDQFGNEYIPSVVSWNATGNVDIDSETGLLTGIADGNYQVEIIADGVSGYANGSVVSSDCEVSLVGSLSLNKSSTASSFESNAFNAGFANDGNTATDWRSKFADNQWWYVELGSTYNIHEVNIDWGVNFATSYELQYRDADGVWRVFYKDLSANGGIDKIGFDGSVSTDAIRLWSFSRSGPWGFNVNEVEVYGVCTPDSQLETASAEMAVLLYPNPPEDVVNLRLNNNKEGKWTAELYDAQFNSHGEVEINLKAGSNVELPFRMGGLYRGTYFLKLTDYDGEVTVLRILKE
nr:S8 family serine peptidase [Marinigracilibium pacificum]